MNEIMNTHALPNILSFVHQLLRSHIQAGDDVMDGTAGNGHDTLLLAQCVGNTGKVYAFDIQAAALDATAQRLQIHGLCNHVKLIQDGHENAAQYISVQLSAAVFNLGYLPSGDKNITTMPETSVQAIKVALNLLKEGGLLVVVIYHGHQTGKLEKQALERFFSQLPTQNYRVMQYALLNRPNCPPFVIAVEKIKAA
ncbi:MAG: class I SAM-dependent methyltransferase [Alysiella sp.]|uniref:class I SAM-dependent methyltransferase n=1 Tax=Alysiella sp. TaxID=1872483 RepID=UPI0026DB4825|nr:class I SAM-dependent methyltransferase [Alysiella sp.]MDO4434720.1 class I SAM-dependent methyltransferase [Alysiella sp.]